MGFVGLWCLPVNALISLILQAWAGVLRLLTLPQDSDVKECTHSLPLIIATPKRVRNQRIPSLF